MHNPLKCGMKKRPVITRSGLPEFVNEYTCIYHLQNASKTSIRKQVELVFCSNYLLSIKMLLVEKMVWRTTPVSRHLKTTPKSCQNCLNCREL